MKDLVSEIVGRLKSADKDLTQAIASGINVHSFDAYQRQVGKREGISEALAIIDELLSEDNNDL